MQQYRGTTILTVRRGDTIVMGGDGQVSLGNTVMKGNARKVRPLAGGRVIAGFAGGTADAFTLFELFEAKLEQHQASVRRAAIELAKEWRTDRALRRLAEEEGIEILTRRVPVRVLGESKVLGLRVIETRAGTLDAGGRREPVQVADTEADLEADMQLLLDQWFK